MRVTVMKSKALDILSTIVGQYCSTQYTVCPRSSDPVYTVTYFIKWALHLGEPERMRGGVCVALQ